MFNVMKNQELSNDNEYKATFVRYGIHIYQHEVNNIQPLIIFRNIISTKGYSKGKTISKFGFSLMKGKFLRLAERGTLNPGATMTFSGYTCPVQMLPGVAHVIWPNNIHQLNHMNHREPFPDRNKAIVGMVICNNPVKYSNVPGKEKYIYCYKQWKQNLYEAA